MAKRFSDTEKWSDPWFSELTPELKLLWLYILDSCDHAGIWNVNQKLAEFKMGITPPWGDGGDKIPEGFRQRVFGSPKNPGYWFIPKFLSFQYGRRFGKGDAFGSALEKIDSKGFSDIFKRSGGESLGRVRGGSREGLGTLRGESQAKAKAKATAKAKAMSLVVKEGESEGKVEKPVSHVAFVQAFKETYQALTGQPFRETKLHYIMAARIIRENGEAAAISKAKILGQLCKDRAAWFTKGGWADFTIETLSKHWNSILEDVKQDKEAEFMEEMKKLEEKNAELNRHLNGQ